MKDYRISKSREEIIKIVQKKFEHENTFSIWQKDPATGERSFKGSAKFYSLDVYEGCFSVLLDDQLKEKFNPSLETYFLLEAQDFVFKTKTSTQYKSGDKFLLFQIPHDIRLKELRVYPRHYCPPEEERSVVAKFENKIENEKVIDLNCRVYNISRSGICIIVSKETLSNIRLGSSIELEGLGFFEQLSNKTQAIIRNARPYTKKGLTSDEYYALGLEFQATV